MSLSVFISFILFSTNVPSGLVLLSQLSTHCESVHTCFALTVTFNSFCTNLKHLVPMRAANSSSLGMIIC